jgi:tetratricopeptide (TPR) repeat protein
LRTAHPEHPRLLLAEGRLELEAGNYEAATDALREARALDPGNDDILFALAAAVRARGNPDEAKQLLAEADHLRQVWLEVRKLQTTCLQEPLNIEARYQIGKLLMSIQARNDARIWLNSVLQLDPEHEGARAALQNSGG